MSNVKDLQGGSSGFGQRDTVFGSGCPASNGTTDRIRRQEFLSTPPEADPIRGAASSATKRSYQQGDLPAGSEASPHATVGSALLSGHPATRPEHLEVPDHPKEIPVVMLNATAPDGIPAVLPDEYEGARKIVNLLLDAGHTTDLAIIGRSREQPEDKTLTVGVRRRLDGIWASLKAHGVSPIAQVPCEPWSLETGYAAVREIRDAGIRPRALICLNDRIAFGAYRALKEENLHIPDDVSIVSFDDDDIAVYLEPKLTTAAFPYEQMGEVAVRVILDDGTPQPEYLVEMPLRVRGSVKLPQ